MPQNGQGIEKTALNTQTLTRATYRIRAIATMKCLIIILCLAINYKYTIIINIESMH